MIFAKEKKLCSPNIPVTKMLKAKHTIIKTIVIGYLVMLALKLSPLDRMIIHIENTTQSRIAIANKNP